MPRRRPPRARKLTHVVIVRVATTATTRDGTVTTYLNAARRAYVRQGAPASVTRHGREGSTSSGYVLLGPPDPGVSTGDLIAVLPKLAGAPPSPAAGACWVDETAVEGYPLGRVLRWTGSAAEVLGPVPAGTSDVLAIEGPGHGDVKAPVVLVAEGPAVDVGGQGVAFKVECGGRS